MATFTIYTYQFSPLTSSQGDLFTHTFLDPPGQSLIRAEYFLNVLHEERHIWLARFFNEQPREFFLSDGTKQYECKILANQSGVVVLRIANEKSDKREIHFQEFREKNQPSCLVIIDNREEGIQTVCVQHRPQAFRSTKRVAAILESALNNYLKRCRLRLGIKAKYFTSEFWSTLSKNPQGIEQVEFHFPYPNMAAISDLVSEITVMAKQTNSEPTLSLKGQHGENLHITPEMEFVINAIKACAASGYPVFVKPRGLRRKEIGTLSEVKEELADSVFENLEKQDLFNGNFIHILEFLKKIKLIYDE